MAETTDRGIAHDLGNVGEQIGFILATGREPHQRFLLTHRADPARNALTARFIPEESTDPEHKVDKVGLSVEYHHYAGPQ